MARFSTKTKSILLLIAFVSIASTAAADSNWTVEKKTDLSQDIVSPESPTIQVVNISASVYDERLDDPTQLTPDRLSEDSNITYNYNQTANASDLTHMSNGLWYASFNPNTTKGGGIKYAANGTTPNNDIYNSTEEANETETLTLGDYKLELQNSYSESVKAGRNFEIEVLVTNTTSGSVVSNDETSLDVYFQNNTYTGPKTDIDNPDSDNNEIQNLDVNYPDSPDSTFIMHVVATNPDNSNDVKGTTSRIVNIAPQVQGEISEFSTDGGCDTQSLVENCEQGTNISLTYDITNSNAENVNLSLYAFNSSGRYMMDTMNLTDEGGSFTGEVTVPDLNTSMYMKEMEFVFNATNNYRRHVDRHNVTLETFKIQDRSPPTTYLGQDYNMDIFLGKPYSLTNYGPERFDNITATVTDSNNTEIQTLQKEDLTYSESQGIMEGSLLIGEENPAGSYGLDIEAENIYGESKTLNSGFSVSDVDATFNAETDNEWSVERLEPRYFMIEVENLLGESHELDYEITELEDQLEVTNNSINLNAGETENVEVEVNLTELSDTEGEIKFIDSSTNYNQTVDIEIDTPNCAITVGNLCSETDSIDVSAGSTGEIVESIELRYVGPQDSSETYNVTAEGEITPYLQVENQSDQIEISDQQDITLTFQPEAEGYYSGEAIFENDDEELSVPVSLDYNSDPESGQNSGSESTASITVSPSSIDLGTVVSGETASETVTVTNNGENEITSITASSTYTVTAGSSNIAAEDFGTVTLTFEDVSSSSGTVDLTATTSSGEATETVSVSASPIQNYGEMTSDLRDRLSRLQSDASTEQQSDLTEASTQISQIETQWDAGNYQEAESTYTEVSNTLDQVETEIDSQQTDTGQTNNNEQSSGGLPLIPIIGGVVILFLVIGFVFYESYIPEKGDPLYSVLGEDQ